MSLFTRTILLISLMALSVSIAVGVSFGDPSIPSDIDEMVAARNYRRAIAYRIAALQGGEVAKTGVASPTGSVDPDGGESRPGASVKPERSILASRRAYWEKAVKAVEDSADDSAAKNEELRTAIRSASKEARSRISRIRENTIDIRNFAGQLDTYQAPISTYTNIVFGLDYQIQQLNLDRDATLVELEQVRQDEGRLLKDLANLEDENYLLLKRYTRTARVLANYSKYDPDIAAAASRVGDPWVRGRVTQASKESTVGLVWVSIGEQDGLRANQKLAIYRDEQFVAYMTVDVVDRNAAQGSLLPEFRGNVSIHSGDVVRPAKFGLKG